MKKSCVRDRTVVEELKDSNRGKNGMKRLFLEEIGVGNQGCYRSEVVGCEEGIMAGRYGEFGGSGLSLADFSFSSPPPFSFLLVPFFFLLSLYISISASGSSSFIPFIPFFPYSSFMYVCLSLVSYTHRN